MRLFECQACGQPLYFENTSCESCGRRLGYLSSHTTMSALEPDGERWIALAEPKTRYIYCANAGHESCNWLIPADSKEDFCIACRHNRMIPDLSDARNLMLWRRVEVAKHRLFYSLLRLRLPLATKMEDSAGLAFDFLAPTDQPVMTGHSEGVVTINLAEADDSAREAQRGTMDEPYRTLLGHFRHEMAHYYWDRLVRNGDIEGFRTIFGDERVDYYEALQRHYREGPPADWTQNFVTAYASTHPWEDFAETWAHYLHIVDTLETARDFGIRIRPIVGKNSGLAASINFDPYAAKLDELIGSWLPLTFAVNSINRSMGLNDLYPFVLTATTLVKLDFICSLVHGLPGKVEVSTLRAMVAALKAPVPSPR